MLAGVGRGAQWNRDHASRKEAGGGDHPHHGTGTAGKSGTGAGMCSWWRCAHDRLYRTIERHLSRTAGLPSTHKPACCFPRAGVTHGHVCAWVYVHFLSRASRTLQRETLGQAMSSCGGQWPDRSCLDLRCIALVHSGSYALGRAQATRTTTTASSLTSWIASTASRIFAGSALALPAQRSFLLDHRVGWLYQTICANHLKRNQNKTHQVLTGAPESSRLWFRPVGREVQCAEVLFFSHPYICHPRLARPQYHAPVRSYPKTSATMTLLPNERKKRMAFSRLKRGLLNAA
jgi:hypothetical protein